MFECYSVIVFEWSGPSKQDALSVMARVTDFEDLACWQKARMLVNIIYDVTKNPSFKQDFKLRDQLRSAAVSAMSNIAEGFARFHKKDFIRFLDISQSSAAEVKSLMYVVLDQEYAPLNQVKDAQVLADESRKITLGLLRYVKQSLRGGSSSVHEPAPAYVTTSEEGNAWNPPDEFIFSPAKESRISSQNTQTL